MANYGSHTVSLLHNTSLAGLIDEESFAPAVSFPGGGNNVALGDLDGDGKADLALVTEMSSTLALLRNTSRPGTLDADSFAPRVEFATGWNVVGIAAGDLDGDGKPDLVFCNAYDDSITLYRNTVGEAGPAITASPESQTALTGAAVTFHVTASGATPLDYQWQYNGVDIPGANSPELLLGEIHEADAGDYTVVVRNAGGSATSAPARLTVQAERVLSVLSPSPRREGDLVEVPIELTSSGEVGGMTFVLRYDPDYLSAPEVDWGKGLKGALKQMNVPALGQVRLVFALPATTVPAGTETVATVSFRARSLFADVTTQLDLELADASLDTGEPILYGTALHSGRAALLASSGKTGDNNGNDRVDIGDVTLVLRLLGQLDSLRAWDVSRNDLNHNGRLDSGDVIKALRLTANIDGQPAQGGVAFASVAGADPAPGSDLSLPGPIATLTPIRSSGSDGQLVTIQVRLQNLLRPISGVTFTLDYPVAALRLEGPGSHRAGPMVPLDALAVWNVAPAQNNYEIQNGRLTLAVSTATPWPADGVLATFTFVVQPGASVNYRWPLKLHGMEVTGNGFDNRPVPTLPAAFIGRKPRPGSLAGLRRLLSGEWEMSLAGDVDASYKIEWSEDLVHWITLTEAVNSSGSMPIRDPEPARHSRRFYRALPAE